MEGEKLYTPETSQNPEGVKEIKSILDASLSGKSEAELTPEQQEAELEFTMRNLESFLEKIDKEEVMAHGTGNPIKVVLSTGIRSIGQRRQIIDPELRELARKGKTGDPQFQRITSNYIMANIIEPYAKFLMQRPDDTKLREEKEKLLKKIPEIGRKRVQWFLDNTIPKFLEAGLDPNYIRDNFEGHHAEAGAHHGNHTAKGKEVFKIWPKDNRQSEDSYKSDLNTNLWWEMASIIGGVDLVSATPSKYLKLKFGNKSFGIDAEFDYKKLLSDYGPVAIFFDVPDEIRRYNLSHATFTHFNRNEWDQETASDIGISNKITPAHFKAISLGDYDHKNRTLYLPPNVQIDDISELINFQKKGVKFFDSNQIPLPPLESIKFLYVGYKSIDWPFLDKDTPEGQHIIEVEKNNNIRSYELIQKIIKKKGYKWGKDEDETK